MDHQIDTLLDEQRRFPPDESFARTAQATADTYRAAAADRLQFWSDRAAELEWFTPPQTVLEWNPPHAKWFAGGELNVSVNCLDRHARGARRDQPALLWEGEPGDRRVL